MKSFRPTALFILLFTIIQGCNKDVAHNNRCLDCPIEFSEIDSNPVWSPDGEWIAYFHHGSQSNKTGIYLIKPDGSENKLWLVSQTETPEWSQDGKQIVYSYEGQIVVFNFVADSLSIVNSKRPFYFPSWSNDDKFIAYNRLVCDSLPCGIWLSNLKDRTNKLLVQYGMYPEFHPFKPEILYNKRWVEKNGNVLGDSVFSVNYITGEIHFIVSLSKTQFVNRYFKYNNFGNKLLFISKSRDSLPGLWLMDSDGNNLTKLFSPSSSAYWSPDGNKIVYTDCHLNDGRLWIMNSDGSNKYQLTFTDLFNN